LMDENVPIGTFSLSENFSFRCYRPLTSRAASCSYRQSKKMTSLYDVIVIFLRLATGTGLPVLDAWWGF
ncbi:MAG: hypothetical protein K6G81_11120, partial [Lachnospiraceae bacterium]|nr:hypothetical protein [Lachnospiraceae bacterium]